MAQIHFGQSPNSSHCGNEDQVELSGCCYRSIDFTAIDSENTGLEAHYHDYRPGTVFIKMSRGFWSGNPAGKKKKWIASCTHLIFFCFVEFIFAKYKGPQM
jgi:hypothetical protein